MPRRGRRSEAARMRWKLLDRGTTKCSPEHKKTAGTSVSFRHINEEDYKPPDSTRYHLIKSEVVPTEFDWTSKPQKRGGKIISQDDSLKVMNMETEHPGQTCDQPVLPQSATRCNGDNLSAIQGARGLGEAEEPDPQMVSTVDVKRRMTSSGIQCPYCRYRCGARFSFQIHVGSQHPLHCEDVCVGRLGKVVFYQGTAKLFHCHICFFTSKDYAVLFEHLLARHCFTVQKSVHTDKDEASDTVVAEVRNADHDGSPEHTSQQDSLKRKRSPASGGEDGVEDEHASENFRAAQEERAAAGEPYSKPSSVPCHECEFGQQSCKTKGSSLHHSTCTHAPPKLHPCTECSEIFMLESLLIRHTNLHHRQKLYRCPYCVFESSLPGLHQHLSQCRAAELNENRVDAGTEQKE